MTPQEAIKELKSDKELYESDIVSAGDGTPDGDLILALDMAISALEKQIAKETVTTSDDVFEFGNCPQCNETFNTELVCEYEITHCPWCGQALDWGG